jgi:hypothetical protein
MKSRIKSLQWPSKRFREPFSSKTLFACHLEECSWRSNARLQLRYFGRSALRCSEPVLNHSLLRGLRIPRSLEWSRRERSHDFEESLVPRTVLTLSESVFRFIDTRQMIPV